MERKNYSCDVCDNECRLSLRGDSSDMPEDCPVDAYDDSQAEWELDLDPD